MNVTVGRAVLQAWRVTVLVCVAGASIAWSGPDVPSSKKTAPKSVPANMKTTPRSETTTRGGATDENGPGLPIGPNTNYAMQVPVVSVESSSPMQCNVGKPMDYQILVKNIGLVPAEQVEVRSTFTAQSSFIATDPPAKADGSTLLWQVRRLDPGAQQKLSVQLKPLAEGELSCNTSVAFRSSSSLKVQVGQPKLKLTCEGPAETTVGSDVHLVLMVHNTGTGAAGEVRISGQLLSVIQPNSAVQPASTARPLAANEPSQSVTQVGVLEPGESRVVDTVLSAREAGTFRLVLSASCEDGAKASASHEVTVQGRPEPVTQEPGSR